MVPDCIIPPVNSTVRVDLRHHVGLSLGPAVDMTNWSPEANLERALCPASLADTLGLQRRAYLLGRSQPLFEAVEEREQQ